MEDVGSLISITLTIFLVPLVLRRIPYFKRQDVKARRAAKAKLPGWVSAAEMSFFVASEVLLVPVLFSIENHVHQVFHQGRNIVGSIQPSFSADLIFWLIQVIAPLVFSLPLGMLLANLISWLIPPIRKIEYKIMDEDVPGYTWHDLNFGLIKAILIMSPVCLILASISLIRF